MQFMPSPSDSYVIEEKVNEIEVKEGTNAVVDVNNHGRGYYDYSASLPIEFYHYYHGSRTDMGTLIEGVAESMLYIRLLFSIFIWHVLGADDMLKVQWKQAKTT
ncbi:unnamed protein product [Lactuca virosa]|uniref:Uncharacterized protein n=1 Tax=Lactuca virosa TaxID=75947 RepID=A0AAU9PMH7_9ASTR|nr:unnamed protein product [Lactuca virosa]